MQGGGRAVKADIGHQFPGLRLGIQPLEIRTLVNKAAPGEGGEEIGFGGEGGHGGGAFLASAFDMKSNDH